MFFKKKNINISFQDMLNDVALFKKIQKKVKNKKDYESARQLGLYYFHIGNIASSLFWYEEALKRGSKNVLIDLSKLHFHCVSNKIFTIEDIVGKISFSKEKAYSYIEKAIEYDIPEAYTLKTRYLVVENKIDEDTIHFAIKATHHKDDWARTLVLLGCTNNYKECLNGLTEKEALKYWCNLFPVGHETGILLSKFIIMNKIEDGFIGFKDDYINKGSIAEHPESMYILGRHLLTNSIDIFKGENLLRKSLKKGFLSAGVFLADWKTRYDKHSLESEIINIYKECALKGSVSAKCVLAIRQLSGKDMGLSASECHSFIEEGVLSKEPLALAWINRNKPQPVYRSIYAL